MNTGEKVLCSGVKKIISQYSPVSRTDEVSRFQRSSHLKREMLFVIQGTSSFMINNSVYPSEPGTLFFIDSWIPHAFKYTPEDDALQHLWIHFEENRHHLLAVVMDIENGKISPLKNILFLRPEYAEILKYRLEQFDLSEQKDSRILEICIRDAVNGILSETAFQLYHQELLQNKKKRVSSVIESVKAHITLCNGRNCSYKELEQISGFSASYLSHQFRECVGMSIGKYIDQARIDYTVAALKRGMKQKEIAYELGFSSPVNFWSWLRKHRDKIH